ncbi:hypothetical protein CJ481_15935 [Bacillus subtilis]|nr:hypothetical protein CJ481_15935 [Bacillus subtilis]
MYNYQFQKFHQNWDDAMYPVPFDYRNDYLNFNPYVESFESDERVTFPLRGSQHTELGDHRRMATNIIISSSGRLDATTKTWTSKKWKGFTGTVVVFLTDSRGNILYATASRRYGVNGTALGGHNRTDTWYEIIPRSVLNKTTAYAIHHAYTPTPRINPTEFKKWSDAIAPLVKAYSEGQQREIYLFPEVHEAIELEPFTSINTEESY